MEQYLQAARRRKQPKSHRQVRESFVHSIFCQSSHLSLSHPLHQHQPVIPAGLVDDIPAPEPSNNGQDAQASLHPRNPHDTGASIPVSAGRWSWSSHIVGILHSWQRQAIDKGLYYIRRTSMSSAGRKRSTTKPSLKTGPAAAGNERSPIVSGPEHGGCAG